MMLVDTHCHLNDSKAFPEPAVEIDEARRNGVERLFVVGIEPSSWQSAIELAERFPAVYAIVGWHPNHSVEYTRDTLDHLRTLMQHPKVLALGEIGLDYHWDFASPEQQGTTLLDQLQLAREMNLPVVFHCREAYPDLLGILEGQPRHPYLFHCFAGNADDARRAVELDSYFGVDGPITYKKNDELRAVISSLPRDRIVVETDSPYLSPEPFRGKPNRPAHVRIINDRLAQILGISSDHCAGLTTSNAERFFRLEP